MPASVCIKDGLRRGERFADDDEEGFLDIDACSGSLKIDRVDVRQKSKLKPF